MAAWVLVPCLKSLFAEFDQLAPNRDRASDGAVGDRAHAAKGSSDHLPDEETPALRSKDSDGLNEVHAIDVDRDLRLPGWSMERVVQTIVTRCRSGAETRLQYVIFNRKIWSKSWGWTARAYTGANAHDHHAHFSARYDTASEQNTKPWGLLAANTPEEDDMPITEGEWKRLEALFGAVPNAVWERNIGKATGTPSLTAQSALVTANVRAGSAANDQLPKVTALLTQLLRGQLDPAQLADMLGDAVVKRMPADRDDVTADELKTAVAGALRDLFV
jgi:hypothetical protein